MNVLIIGGGIAGLTAARVIAAAGHAVLVADRGRVPGGRVATRRVLNGDAGKPEHASLAFDHGAQYFTARDARFAAAVDAWCEARVVQAWHGRLAVFDSEGREPIEDGQTRWVGVPAMTAVARHLARDLDVRSGVHVDALDRHPAGWVARARSGDAMGPYDAVIVAVPPREARPLVQDSPALARDVGAVVMHPCWAALVAFDDRVSAPFDGAFVTSSPLGWIARDRSKPQRGLAETWVLHAGAGWSAAHVDDDAEAVAAFLLNAFADLVRARLPLPIHLSAHRWRDACADPPLGTGALVDADRRLIVCGDWCAGNRVEGAYLSGLGAAGRLAGF